MSKVAPLEDTKSRDNDGYDQMKPKTPTLIKTQSSNIDEEYDDEDEGGYHPMIVRRKTDALGIGSALSQGMLVGGLATNGVSALGEFGASLTKTLADKSGVTAGMNATLHLTNAALDKSGVKKGLNAVANATGANAALEVAKHAAELAKNQALAAAAGAAGAATAGLGVLGVVGTREDDHGPMKSRRATTVKARHSSAKAFANSSHDGKLRSPYPEPIPLGNEMDVVEFEAVEYLCYENAREVRCTREIA
jgi:hypothetical protein